MTSRALRTYRNHRALRRMSGVVAITLASVLAAACAPSTGSASKGAAQPSATADVDNNFSLDKLVAAAQKEGSVTVYDTVTIATRPSHARVGVVRRLIDPPNVRLAAERFDPEPVLELEVRRSLLETVLAKLTDERVAYQLRPD